MEFLYTPPQTEFEEAIGGHYHINAFGKIESDDWQRFKEFLERNNPPRGTTIYIDSAGGNVEEAIKIGTLIREYELETSVGCCQLNHKESGNDFMIHRDYLSGQCFSAATLVYLGGVLRHFLENSQFGVHQFSFQNPNPRNIEYSQKLSAKIALYIENMGISQEFLEMSASTHSENIICVEEDELKRLNIITGGETSVEWSLQGRQGIMYVRGERYSIFGHHKIILTHSQDFGFIFHAVIESQNREEELMSFPFVEIALEEENKCIDISQRCSRMMHNGYANISVNITSQEAKKIAFSQSIGLYIRLTVEAGVFLGIAAMKTEKGEEKLQTFFNTFNA